ncbi:Profilin-4 [Polyrhizophydium stewartii]|uniref:Profilin n=1 Tax=Polyrhizophydium stewartii TaxID=2732419 RepID=A0ABR4NK44_9FUNG
MNSLLQEALMGTRHISHAAIVRQKDGAIKAKSPNFALSPTDLQKIEAAFEHPRDVRSADNGIVFLDTPYRAVRADSMSVYAKNYVRRSQDKSGVIISKTSQHYIIAAYDPTMYASVAVEAVEKLGEAPPSKCIRRSRLKLIALPKADYFRKKSK